jgi:hypothetical protein
MPNCKRSGCRFNRARDGPAGCNSDTPHRCCICRDPSAFVNLETKQLDAIFGVVRRVVDQNDPTRTQLMWERLSHSPEVVADMEMRLLRPPKKRKRQRSISSSSSGSDSSSRSSSSSSSSASGVTPSTVGTDAASDVVAIVAAAAPAADSASDVVAIVAAAAPAAVVDAPSSDVIPAREVIRINTVHQLVGVALDQERSPWCTEHAMAVAASASIFGRYALVCPAQKFLDIWLQKRVPRRQWPSDFCSELEPFSFRQGDEVYTVRVAARLLSDVITACEHIRRSAGYWHIVVVSRHGASTHSMAAVTMNFNGQIVCANSHGGRMAKVTLDRNAFVCAYVVSCEVRETISALTSTPVANPPEDSDWDRLVV